MKILIKNTLKPLRWGGVIKPASLKGYKVPLWLRGRVNDREFSRYANIPGLIASGGINSDEISTIINVFFFFSFFFLMTLEERVKKASSTFFFFTIRVNIITCLSIRTFLIIHLMERLTINDADMLSGIKLSKTWTIYSSLCSIYPSINNSKRE